MAALMESLFQANDQMASFIALVASLALVVLVRRAVSRARPSSLN